jgi:hypothetical protein
LSFWPNFFSNRFNWLSDFISRASIAYIPFFKLGIVVFCE